MSEAVKYNVLPIDDRVFERLDAKRVGRPDLMGDRTSLTLYAGMTGMSENAFINVKNRSVSITAEVVIPKGGGNGAILVQGGRFGGWGLYMKGGRPAYTYNFLGLKRTTIAAKQAIPAGKATIRMDFEYDGGGLGKGGAVLLFVDGKQVAEGRIDRTQPLAFSLDDATDVGVDEGTPIIEDYQPKSSKFTGTIVKVVVDVGVMTANEKLAARKANAEAAARIAEAQ
jgi:arylsulfatase